MPDSADKTNKQELVAELANARNRIKGYTAAVRHDLDLGARLKKSVAGNRLAWFAGAVVVGLLLSKIPPFRRKAAVDMPTFGSRQKEKAGKAAMLLAMVKFGLDFAKPALAIWARRRIAPKRDFSKTGAV